MATTKDSSVEHPTTTDGRGVCAGCGERAKVLQTPRPNVGHGYKGPMFCRPCNPRFLMLDMHHSSLERLSV